MTDYDYKTGGLRQKYNITKVSGEPVDDDAVYFVLRIDKDPHARIAIQAYAESVKNENNVLADELLILADRFDYCDLNQARDTNLRKLENGMSKQQHQEFEGVTRPVIEWLNANCHPHVTVVIEPTRAELSEGTIGYTTDDYLRD